MTAILAHREVAPLLSDDHFSVDGTLVKAWASMKSFQPKVGDTPPEDDPGSPPGPDATAEDQPEPTEPETAPMPRPSRQSRNAEVDFQGEKRSNATHASTTDPDARLYKKSPGTGAMLCSIGHALMDMKHGLPPVRGPCRLRNGLIVQGDLTQSDGHAERRAALDPRHGHSDQWRSHGSIHRHSPGSTRKLTLGADKSFDAAQFVADLRKACVTPHVAQKVRHSAIDVNGGARVGHGSGAKPCQLEAVYAMARALFIWLARTMAHWCQPLLMAKLADLAPPEMGATAGFHGDDTRRQLPEELQHLRTTQLLAQHRPACAVGTMHLERILRQIKPDRDNLRHDRSPLWILAEPPWRIDAVGGAVTASEPDGPARAA